MKTKKRTKKQINKLYKEFAVLQKNTYSGEEPSIKIVGRDSIEEIRYCQTYNEYGIEAGCYDAGCYCFGNSSSEFRDDCLEEIQENFDLDGDYDLSGITTVEEMINLFEDHKKYEKIKTLWYFISVILGWEKENEQHTMCKAITHSDGANYRSYLISHEYENEDWPEMDEDESKEILAEMPESTPYIEGASTEIETENYRYIFTRYATDWGFCGVENL